MDSLEGPVTRVQLDVGNPRRRVAVLDGDPREGLGDVRQSITRDTKAEMELG